MALKGKLYIICGHGAGDPGACANGYQEAERVRVLGKEIKALGGSKVVLCDISRNYYADNGISNMSIGKNDAIIELHMDSAAAGARGAHVIIKKGYKADSYDKALAKELSVLLPGRSSTIVGRSELANPNRAASRGFNYRLVEFGFISSKEDVKIFNANITKIAKIVLESFGISASGTSTKPDKETKPSTGGSITKKTKLSVDGKCGPATVKAKQKLYKTTQDGKISGQPSTAKTYNYALVQGGVTTWKEPSKAEGSRMVAEEQEFLKKKGYYTGEIDGYQGPKHNKALQKYLKVKKYYNGKVDGYYGPDTCKADQKRLNAN